MRNTRITPYKESIKSRIQGTIDNVAADKSISHRSVIFSLLSSKPSYIKNYLFGQDTLNTLKIAMQLGLRVLINEREISQDDNNVDNFTQFFMQHWNLQNPFSQNLNLQNLNSQNPRLENSFSQNLMQQATLTLIPHKNGILEPTNILDCGNAGTAIRMYIGLLASRSGYFVLSGDKYLRNRPMQRVIEPLNNIGANIIARQNNTLAPISVQGRELQPFDYKSQISSAQVKSAMLLSALNINGVSYFDEISKSRDHSERMLCGMGANLQIEGTKITIHSNKSPLKPLEMEIPNDPSSAFYFAILASIAEDSRIVLKNILLNETRIEAFKVLQSMGANVKFIKKTSKYEDIGDIEVCRGELSGVCVDSNISWLIDEIPALAIAFAFAKGESKVCNAKELRYKESDRIVATLAGLRAFGVKCEELESGFVIQGGLHFRNDEVEIESFGDHRIAMSFAILGVFQRVKILDSACIDVSFPNFLEILSKYASIENENETSE